MSAARAGMVRAHVRAGWACVVAVRRWGQHEKQPTYLIILPNYAGCNSTKCSKCVKCARRSQQHWAPYIHSQQTPHREGPIQPAHETMQPARLGAFTARQRTSADGYTPSQRLASREVGQIRTPCCNPRRGVRHRRFIPALHQGGTPRQQPNAALIHTPYTDQLSRKASPMLVMRQQWHKSLQTTTSL